MTTEAAPKKGFTIPKIVWDLIFTLAIPLALLSPNLFGKDGQGNDIGFPDILGIVTTYVVAALIPAMYILIDTLRTRQFNPVTTVAASSALIGGGLAFLQVSGAAFALKDSYRPIVFALVMGGSLLIGKPFFQVFLRQALTDVTNDKKPLLEKLFVAPSVRTGLRNATLVIALESIAMAVINFFVNLNIVTAPFNTKDQLAQIGQANATLWLPSTIASMLAFGAAYWLVQRGITKDFGPKAQLFEDGMWDALRGAPLGTTEGESTPDATRAQLSPALENALTQTPPANEKTSRDA
jgi:hypothetical protein